MHIAFLGILSLALLQLNPVVFETDMPPGDGRPIMVASVDDVQLFEEPSSDSKVRTLAVTFGQLLRYREMRYVTIRPGRLTTLMASRIDGQMIGAVEHVSKQEFSDAHFAPFSMDVPAGTSIDYLQGRTSRSCFLRIGGNVVHANPCPIFDQSSFKLETRPATEFWIRVRIDNDMGGWLRTGGRIKEVGRTDEIGDPVDMPVPPPGFF